MGQSKLPVSAPIHTLLNRKDLTQHEKMVVALYKLIRKRMDEGNLSVTVSRTELVLTAWKEFPFGFGLRGAETEHPDSHTIMSCLFGERGCIKRGLLRITAPNVFEVIDPQIIHNLNVVANVLKSDAAKRLMGGSRNQLSCDDCMALLALSGVDPHVDPAKAATELREQINTINADSDSADAKNVRLAMNIISLVTEQFNRDYPGIKANYRNGRFISAERQAAGKKVKNGTVNGKGDRATNLAG